jgi:hypothetical protein
VFRLGRVDLDLRSNSHLNAVASRAALPEVTKITRRVLTRAKILAPVRTGRLRSSGRMDIKITNVGPSGSVTFPVSYAQFVHEGTRAHIIRAKKKKVLKFKGRSGAFVFRKVVHHPGTRARPFLQRALEETAPASGFEVHSRS